MPPGALRRKTEMDDTIVDILPLTIVELAPVRDDQGQIVDFIWVYANEMSNRVVLPEGGSIVGQRVCDIDPPIVNPTCFLTLFSALRRASHANCSIAVAHQRRTDA